MNIHSKEHAIDIIYYNHWANILQKYIKKWLKHDYIVVPFEWVV